MLTVTIYSMNVKLFNHLGFFPCFNQLGAGFFFFLLFCMGYENGFSRGNNSVKCVGVVLPLLADVSCAIACLLTLRVYKFET